MKHFPANTLTTCCFNVGQLSTMLDQSIKTTLDQRIVLSGLECWWEPSKHEALTQCWFNIGPSSTTLAQHCVNIDSTSRVFWVALCCNHRKLDSYNPANTGNSPNAVSMLVHRLRRWTNIETALDECPVLAGKACFKQKPADISSTGSTLKLH